MTWKGLYGDEGIWDTLFDGANLRLPDGSFQKQLLNVGAVQ